MNRAQRRQAMREQVGRSRALLQDYDKAQRVERLMTQGISPADLEKAHADGFDEGYRMAGMSMIRAAYSAAALGLHEDFGFGRKRVVRALNAMDRHIAAMITGDELRDEVAERLGFEINFNEGVNRVEEKR